MSKIPSAGVPVTLKDILSGLFTWDTAGFRDDLARFTGAKHVGLASTGSAAFYLALRALSARSDRTEVVLPAYTAPVVILPVKKAGLKPVIADVSLRTFNMDMENAGGLVGSNTLAVMPAHMFGIPCDMAAARSVADGAGATLIEDAASALGATIDGAMVGTVGDAGFYSFHRGKQISSVIGGAWVTNDGILAEGIGAEADRLHRPTFRERTALFAQIVAFSLAVRPSLYGAFHSLIARYKDTTPHEDFHVFAYTPLQAGTARSLLKKIDRILDARNHRANRAREMLRESSAVVLPDVLANTRPAFNHCPVLLPDVEKRDRAIGAALDARIECTKLYGTTIHRAYHMQPDEYGGGTCPQADELASRLLLIPCHPLIPMARLEQAAEIVRRVAEQG